MAIEKLPVDYVDDVIDTSVYDKRRYEIIENVDGTISLDEKTEYLVNGSPFGKNDINLTNKTVNDVIDDLDATKERVTTNESNIATNASNIATNTSDIATNKRNIATNTANISTHTSEISTLKIDMAQAKKDISSQGTSITIYGDDISQLKKDVDTNTSDISTNKTNISKNASDISDILDGTQTVDKANSALTSGSADNDIIVANNKSLNFVESTKKCTISDSRITANSLADVYFTNASVDSAREAMIEVNTINGAVVLSCVNIPQTTLVASIRVRVV